jgi:hypothetical protein
LQSPETAVANGGTSDTVQVLGGGEPLSVGNYFSSDSDMYLALWQRRFMTDRRQACVLYCCCARVKTVNQLSTLRKTPVLYCITRARTQTASEISASPGQHPARLAGHVPCAMPASTGRLIPCSEPVRGRKNGAASSRPRSSPFAGGETSDPTRPMLLGGLAERLSYMHPLIPQLACCWRVVHAYAQDGCTYGPNYL